MLPRVAWLSRLLALQLGRPRADARLDEDADVAFGLRGDRVDGPAAFLVVLHEPHRARVIGPHQAGQDNAVQKFEFADCHNDYLRIP